MKRAFTVLRPLLDALPAAAPDAQRSLENDAGDVLQITSNFHQAAVVVTEEGVVVTDRLRGGAGGARRRP
jgi:hypothetical protein